MGVGITLEINNLDAVLSLVANFADMDTDALLTVIGDLGETQTRRRIEEEKTAPDGIPWQENAEGTSILFRTGKHLRNSLGHYVSGDTVAWGSYWEHAHVHQNGAVITPKNARMLSFFIGGRRVFAKKVTIPARPFLGLSDDNKQEIRDVVTDFLGSMQP